MDQVVASNIYVKKRKRSVCENEYVPKFPLYRREKLEFDH